MISTFLSRFGALCVASFASLSLFAQMGVEFSEMSHNLGTLYWKHPAQATFTIKNVSQKPLHILDVDADCGCTMASFTQTHIQPGKTGTISVRYDAQQLGHFNRAMAVYTNLSETPTYLTITGKVVDEKPELQAHYDYHFGSIDLSTDEIDFEDVKKGDVLTKTIHLVNRGNKPVTPSLMHLPRSISANYSPDVLYPGRAGRITLTLNADHIDNFGRTKSSVYLSTKLGERLNKANEIAIFATLLPDLPSDAAAMAIAPALKMDKETLNFGQFEGKNKLTEDILITNNGRSDLVIEALQVFNSGISLKMNDSTIKPGSVEKLKITINKEILRSKEKREILLITNDPRQAKTIITIEVKR